MNYTETLAATTILGVETLPDSLKGLSFSDLLIQVRGENPAAADRILALRDDIDAAVNEQIDRTNELHAEHVRAVSDHEDFKTQARLLVYKITDLGDKVPSELLTAHELKDVKTALFIYS